MKTSLTKEELKNDLLYNTLKALSRSLSQLGIPLYVVGATARDIMMKLLKEDEARRRTNDLDVAIALQDWTDFDKVKDTLQSNHFEKMENKQKFYYKGENNDNDFEVDVVPFGKIATNEQICWPPEGNPVMSVRCFEDVMAHSISILVNGDVSFEIAPLCGQFLIKFDTWIDRHASTDKDATDMYYFLDKYYIAMVMNDVTSPDEIGPHEKEDNLDIIVLSARWIAYDIGNMLNTEHLEYYIKSIQNELNKEEDSMLLYHFMKNMDEDKEDKYEICYEIWSNIKDYMQKRLEQRSYEN